MGLRTFDEWKAEVAAKLLMLPSRGRVETYDFDDQRERLVARLPALSLHALPSYLADLLVFSTFWRVDYRELAPTEEEVRAWFRGVEL